MKTVFKWVGIVLASLIGLMLVAGVVLYFIGNARLNKTYDIPDSDIALPTDAASIEFGKHRVETLCQGCHGADLSGKNNFNLPSLGNLDAPNLTSGEGGIASSFTTEDYVRAIRHGIGPDRKPIFMTAVVSTSQLSDQDLAAIIAYLKTIPPVNHKHTGNYFTPFGRILFGAGLFGTLPAATVSHDMHVTAPPRAATPEYGEYLVNTNDCRICHGPQLNGGPYPDPTVKLITPNITAGGEPGFWTEEQFMTAMRTGKTPGGHELNPDHMPWKIYRNFEDDELKAIWLYLQSLQKLEQYTP